MQPAFSPFEALYVAARDKEGRLYTDEEVAALPAVPANHPYRCEWRVRARSAEKLVRYLRRLSNPLRVLEAGCGNGWLSAALARMPQANVTGIDPNGVEIAQAKRVFGDTNPHFEYGSFLQFEAERPLDVVVFAASVHYFPSLRDVIAKAASLLRRGGEIHIIDTQFYPPGITAPKQRSDTYYDKLGVPGMKAHYFHHTLAALTPYPYAVMNPLNLTYKKLSGGTAFPWIRVRP